MGQYHLIVNLDKHEFLNPWDMGEGAKLMEWGYGSGTMLTALTILLAVSNGRGGGDYHGDEPEWVGRWGGDRIAVIGDYAEIGDLPAEFRADLIWHACSLARERWVPLKKRIAAHEAKREDYGANGGEYVDRWIEEEREVEKMPRFLNISADMRRVIEADGMVRFENKPYQVREMNGTVRTEDHITVMDKERETPKFLRPDMVINS